MVEHRLNGAVVAAAEGQDVGPRLKAAAAVMYLNDGEQQPRLKDRELVNHVDVHVRP